jgi:effector-binding domain-containing protein
MTGSKGYDVSLQHAAPRAIAAIKARIPASRVSSVFGGYLNQVYAAARIGAVQLDGQNVFVYRSVADAPDQLDIEFGVGVTAPFHGNGTVEPSMVPDGQVATTTHWGDYALLRAAHEAVIAWCREQGFTLAGPRWEVYGHWNGGGAKPRTDIYYLIQPRTAE